MKFNAISSLKIKHKRFRYQRRLTKQVILDNIAQNEY